MPRKRSPTDFKIPPDWPHWNVKCDAEIPKRNKKCEAWAVPGMNRCRFHGAGGYSHRRHGQYRYLAWVILGGPKNCPAEAAARLAVDMMYHMIFKQGVGTVNQRVTAAMWLTGLLEAPLPLTPAGKAVRRSAGSPAGPVAPDTVEAHE